MVPSLRRLRARESTARYAERVNRWGTRNARRAPGIRATCRSQLRIIGDCALFRLCRARHKRKNWLFCWTEIGAQYVGVFHSLLATCRLQGIDPYTYLVDVLQRVESHPASDVASLTPRLWKERFAANPLQSAIDSPVKYAVA